MQRQLHPLSQFCPHPTLGTSNPMKSLGELPIPHPDRSWDHPVAEAWSLTNEERASVRQAFIQMDEAGVLGVWGSGLEGLGPALDVC